MDDAPTSAELTGAQRLRRGTAILFAAVLLVLAVLLALAVSGLAKQVAFMRAMNGVRDLGPRQVVETYYESLGRGDAARALACVSDEYRRELSRAAAPDVETVASLTDLRVSEPAKVRLQDGYYDEVRVTADYLVILRDPAMRADGLQRRFLYVGKKTKDSPWKIVTIEERP